MNGSDAFIAGLLVGGDAIDADSKSLKGIKWHGDLEIFHVVAAEYESRTLSD